MEEGRPLCHQFCGCGTGCAGRCVDEIVSLNTSTAMLSRLPECLGNCSVDCQATHYERCSNISALLAAARRPKYVNKTAVCLANIWPTCSLHCLGIPVRNVTVNSSLFHPSKMPQELLALNVTAGFDPDADEGYQCRIEPCDEGMTHCNQTSLQIGERAVYDEISGNTTLIPILMNVSKTSIDGCYANRSSACLSTCSEIAYLICVPEIDPFDLCVQSCVANLTYVDPPYEADASLAVCKKKLRLTPSQSLQRGAAWTRRKQHVREGFRTSFAFRMEQPSLHCPTGAYPSHEEQPEGLAGLQCRGRGGDGFAFVIQDAGATTFDANCAMDVVSTCVDGEAESCAEGCRSLCPSEVRSASHLNEGAPAGARAPSRATHSHVHTTLAHAS